VDTITFVEHHKRTLSEVSLHVFMQNHTTVFMNSIGPCGRTERIARVSNLGEAIQGVHERVPLKPGRCRLIRKVTERPKNAIGRLQILLSDLTFQSSYLPWDGRTIWLGV
jgi:hypothetical protein